MEVVKKERDELQIKIVNVEKLFKENRWIPLIVNSCHQTLRTRFYLLLSNFLMCTYGASYKEEDLYLALFWTESD